MEPPSQDPNISPIKEVLQELFQVGELAHLYKNRDMCYIWSQVCPEKYLDQTRMKSFYRGVLTIEVSSSSILQELSTFYKPQLLEKLQKLKKNRIHKLSFQLGTFPSPR